MPDGGRRRTAHGDGCWFEVDAAAETLARTTVAHWQQGTRINLERSLKIGDELGGHIVTGHVDGVAEIIAREAITGRRRPVGADGAFRHPAPRIARPLHRRKGLGLPRRHSLTVNTVEGDVFSVLIIPHTLAVTTWGERQAGDKLNLEVDLMARYAARLAEAGGAR